MKKGLLIAGLTCFVSLMAMAQKDGKTKFSVGAELGFINGDFSPYWNIGFGANGTIEHFFMEQLSATVQGGVNVFVGKGIAGNNGLKTQDLTIIPITIGARYYIGDSFHAGAQTGVGILGGGVSRADVDAAGVAFAFSPQVGYSFKTNKGKSVDATIKYDVYVKNGNFTSPSLRLSYIF